MSKLSIAPNLELPVEAVVETFAILGVRGSGKTNTGVLLAEEMLDAKQQVVILDPVDVWWGLKSSKDGKQSGYAIPIIGGEHGDVPLEAVAGSILADFVVDNRASVVLSVRHLGMNDQRRFGRDFAHRLYARKNPAEFRTPLMLIIDEADEFVPQRVPPGFDDMFGAFDRLVRRGRSSGIGVTLISQRAQVINKDVLSQVSALIAMRVLHKLDRKAMDAWIEAHDTEGHREEFMSSLASLNRGEGWVWSPSWLDIFKRVQFRERMTYDSSATPKAGVKLPPVREIAAVDLDKLRESMSATIERAKQYDPHELRKRLAELEKQLRAAPKQPPVDLAAIEKARQSGARQERKRLQDSLLPLLGRFDRVVLALGQVPRREIDVAIALLIDKALPAPIPAIQSELPARLEISRIERRSVEVSNSQVSKAGRKILTALAQFGPSPDTKVGALTGYTAGAGHFGNVLAELRGAGHIEGDRQSLQITDSGLKALGPYDPLPSGPDLQEYWFAKLPKGPAAILKVLAEAYPKALSDEEIGELAAMAPKAGHFGNCLSELRTRDLITGPRTALKASEDLF